METDVRFKSGRYNLSGVLHIPSKGKLPYPAVVMFHGFGVNKSEFRFIFTKTARCLSDRGISVLRFDFMGSGDSEGSFEDMTLYTEMKDGENALNFILQDKRFNKNRLGILGLSMGAVTASFIASKYRTKALILWAPVAYPERIKELILTKKLKSSLLKKGRVYFPGMGHYLDRKFFKSLDAVKPINYAEGYRNNVLVICTKDDMTVPFSHSLAYFEAFHKNALFPRLIIFDEGGHGFTNEFSEKNLIEETIGFFSETLL